MTSKPSIPHKNHGVHIDYLCFTFSLKNLRHCSQVFGDLVSVKNDHKTKHVVTRRKHIKAEVIKNKPLLQRLETAPYFPSAPVFNPTLCKSFDDIQSYQDAFDACYRDYLERCLHIFVSSVLGLSLSAPRGLGFQFYSESMKLNSPNGEDFCGFVGIGGNNETVHFQINGTGCKHLFSRTRAYALHDWLYNVLGVTTLARVDLAYDDFDGIFDCAYAEKAWYDNAFRTSNRGLSPVLHEDYIVSRIDADGKKVYTKEQVSVGSRSSRIYWRIYNKALEQNLANTGLIWYRSEVELKKWDVDVLLDPAGVFTSINNFSASISVAPSFNTKPQPTKRAALDLLTQAHWMRRQYGRILNSLIEFHNGDVNTVIGSLVRDGTKFTFPDTYGKLVNHILET